MKKVLTVVLVLCMGAVVAAPKALDISKLKGAVAASKTGTCPTKYPIKGNVGQENIYHTANSSLYKRTKAEVCFDTEANAQKAGFRASKTTKTPTTTQK